MDGSQKVDGEAVVSSCDSPEVLEAAEHALDCISVAVEVGREAILPDPIGLGRDVRHRALGFRQSTDLIAVVALIGMQDPARRKAVEQGKSGCAISYLAADQIEGDRAT